MVGVASFGSAICSAACSDSSLSSPCCRSPESSVLRSRSSSLILLRRDLPSAHLQQTSSEQQGRGDRCALLDGCVERRWLCARRARAGTHARAERAQRAIYTVIGVRSDRHMYLAHHYIAIDTLKPKEYACVQDMHSNWITILYMSVLVGDLIS